MHPYVLLIPLSKGKKSGVNLLCSESFLYWPILLWDSSKTTVLKVKHISDTAKSVVEQRPQRTHRPVLNGKSKTKIENTGQSDFLLLFKEMWWAEMTSFYWDLPELHLLLHSLSYWTLIKHSSCSSPYFKSCNNYLFASFTRKLHLPCHAPSFRRLETDGLRTEGAIHSADCKSH